VRERKQTTPTPKAPRRRVRPEVWVFPPPEKEVPKKEDGRAADDDPS